VCVCVYPHDAMLAVVLAVALCLSVYPSQAGIISKRLNFSSSFWQFGIPKNKGSSLWNYALGVSYLC